MGKPKNLFKPGSEWQSAMDTTLIYAMKSQATRYLHLSAGRFLITEDRPDSCPYWRVSPLAEWEMVSETGQLKLSGFRKYD